MTVRQLVEACRGTLLHGDDNAPILGISLNSREVKEHELFVPLVGEKVNAHRFVASALETGAGAVLTAEHDQTPEAWSMQTKTDENGMAYEKAWIRVADTKKALQDIGRYCRSQLQMPIVGVTGSVGKTTTREMISVALSAGYRVHKTPGNLNSQVGLPITIFQFYQNSEIDGDIRESRPVDSVHEIGVLELGMSEPGELTVIAKIAEVDMAVITNIGIAHIEQLGSQENILREKLTIQDGMKAGGILFLNGDDNLLKDVSAKEGCKTIYYGTGENCQYQAVDIVMKDGYAEFTAVCKPCSAASDTRLMEKSGEAQDSLYNDSIDIRRVHVKLHVPGMHQVLNAMVALAVADQHGVKLDAAAQALGEFGGFKNRQQIYKLGDFTLIDDTYNASPVSMCGAIDILASMKQAVRRIAVLADMKELGADTERYHREVGEHLGKCSVDVLVTYGELASGIERGAISVNPLLQVVHLDTLDAVKQWILQEKQEGDCILLKGSNSMKLGEVAEYVCQCHN